MSLYKLFHDSPTVYTIRPQYPFLDQFASTLLAQYRDDPIGLADVMVFLPTRRAVRALGDAFVAAGEAQSMGASLLPRLRTLGDLEEEVYFAGDMQDILDLPKAISPLERRFVLAQLIYRFEEQTSGMAVWTNALRAADELGKMLDSFHTQQISFDVLANLVPDHYAAHWQVSLDFLKIITEHWPAILESQGKMDPSERRRVLIDRLADRWNPAKGGTPPNHPVIIAGSTGSMPAVGRLMQVVAHLPKGCVVLPGLDIAMDDAGWGKLDDPHPQMGFKDLLNTAFEGSTRDLVKDWPSNDLGTVQKISLEARQKFLSLSLLPADATADWQQRLADFGMALVDDAIKGFHLVEASNEQSEAEAVALLMREALEDPEKRTIFVTPDRTLSARVCARLARWGIALDDSAGVPFANTLRGGFLRLVATWLEDPTEPVSLLTLLKHPLCTVGCEAVDFAPITDALDMALRGLRPGGGFEGLKTRLTQIEEWDALTRDGDEDIQLQDEVAVPDEIQPVIDLLERLEKIATPFMALEEPSLLPRLEAHLRAAENLCATQNETGAARLWSFEDGERGAALMADLCAHAGYFPDVAETSYTELFYTLASGNPVRAHGQTHPRLMILGPLEARLQRADRVILGGLNEGVWPNEAETDPFLSRPMRSQLGLQSPERRIGLAAHDFAQLANAKEVYITRAKRVARAPSKPSRWIVRITNILEACQKKEQIDISTACGAWAASLNAVGEVRPVAKPEPRPPVEARPKKLFVTRVEKLLRDPYGLYASHILKLRKLDGLNANLDNAIRGRFYHSIFAQYAVNHPDKPAANIKEVLETYAQELSDKAMLDDSLKAFWRSPMQKSFNWFVNFDAATRAEGKPVLIEEAGAWTFDVPDIDQSFTLSAKVDRVDLLKNGALRIYDYKTGGIPTFGQQKTFSPQLQLTALIMQNNGFEKMQNHMVDGYGFIKILNRKTDIPFTDHNMDRVEQGEKAQEYMNEAHDALIALIQHFADPMSAYYSQPRAFFQNDYGEHDHLARRGEWAILVGGEDA